MNIAADETTFREQYKSYVQDLGNIGNRHAQTNTWYMSIVSAVLIFLAVLMKDTGYADARDLVCLLGALIAGVWHFHAWSYKYLYDAKFTVLTEMEKDKRLSDCYTKEGEVMPKWRIKFTTLERCLTAVLVILFISLRQYL